MSVVATQDGEGAPRRQPAGGELASIDMAGTPLVETPYGLEWPLPFKAYQLEGIHALISNERLLLADDMGLGKTIQAIAAIRVLTSSRAIQRSLVIVPASLIAQWRRELARWAPDLDIMPIKGPQEDRVWQWNAPADVAIVSYETFRSDFGFVASGRLADMWDVVVIDEAQKIKNRRSEVSRKVKRVRRSRSWALTGTPLENKVDDLASILEFVDHTSDGASRQFTTGETMLQRHRQLQLRRTKSAVLSELPAKQIIKLQVDLHAQQLAAYRRAEQDGIVQLQAHGSAVRITHVLELIMRLKQICNFDPVSGESAKLTDIRERMHVLVEEGHRALVFSQFVNRFGVETAVQWLGAFHPLTFTGSLDASAREAVVRRFREQNRHKVLILSLRAGGVGLNLQEASYVFHLDRWWNPAVERQAEDRTHRLGQQFPVTVYQYVCRNTIEERIDRLISEKQALFDDLIDDVSLDIGSALSVHEIFGLFGLEPPPVLQRASDAARPSLIARCSSFLRVCGWEIVDVQMRRGRFDVLESRSVDTIGLVRSLQIWCADQVDEITLDDVRFVQLHASRTTDAIVIASTADFSGDAGVEARESNIRIWDSRAIVRIDQHSL